MTLNPFKFWKQYTEARAIRILAQIEAERKIIERNEYIDRLRAKLGQTRTITEGK